ncbi:metalloendopeptidase [Elysia marginata]|uniref:Metalloendopeptidase n=1 Tax=Elysia marginata TaxID=1093978 RepID=A0AAV4JY77_9GAST|nr:metalloendopeptidase [Elysia marginata]
MMKSIDRNVLKEDIINSSVLEKVQNATSVTDKVNVFNTVLADVINKHAPVVNRKIVIRHYKQWYTDDIREAQKSSAFSRKEMEKDTPGVDSYCDEGVVEQYLQDREEVEEELEEFYKTAALGDEPDQNSEAMENLRATREILLSAGLPETELQWLLQGDPGFLPENTGSNRVKRSIQKRFIEANEKRRWTDGVVPYVISDSVTPEGRREIYRAMETYERLTCFRFVPWENVNGVTTNQKLGLDHENYLDFIKGSGCYAFLGNTRRPIGGQKVSCCIGKSCVHEIGHSLGEIHEHQTANPDRFRTIRTDFENIQSDKHSAYRNTSAKEIPNSGNFYYMFREVSLVHKCQDRCSDFPLVCQNEGYLTLVDNKCGCVCIPGLDPDTGCTTVLKGDPKGVQFPGGSYAIPAVSSGCPDESFTIGSRVQVNDGKNQISETYRLPGEVTDTKVEQQFCVKDSPSNDIHWTGGNYCIYRKGGECPAGFSEGFIQYSDHPTESEPNQVSGEIPDGEFGDDTRFEYCCVNTGFSADQELYLPSRKEFALIKRQGKNCQRVRNMHVETMSLVVDNAEGGQTKAAVGGDHPVQRIYTPQNGYSTTFCVYKPAMVDCGDIIELDSVNAEVTISSPKAPELECFWLIKAPPGERLQLDFTDFNITEESGECVDKLEVGYWRRGQPGIKICGKRWDKTIVSINNTIHLRLSTFGDSSSGFTATIKLVRYADLCYAASDRGMTYDGDVSFTRHFEPCLPWAEVSHCEIHPFIKDSFTTILEGNKCRNPHQGTGFQPWCYTKAKNCLRNYCDVCLIGKRFDLSDNCAQLKTDGHCSLKYCAKTCADLYPEPSVPVKASEVSCDAPGPAPDGVPVGVTKPKYAVGESVTYKCNYADYTSKRYCLTSGNWSAMGTSCSECPDGYHLEKQNNQCYYFPNVANTYQEASAFCKEKGNAFVAFPINKKENKYLRKDFTELHMWIGITKEADTFLTAQDKPLTYKKWAKGQPNNYKKSEECVELQKDGKWNDLICNRERHFVCQKPMTSLQDCLDRSDKCSELFAMNPSSCTDFPDFAELRCRFTCGLCDTQKTPLCQVTVSGDPIQLARGSTISDTCGKGYVRVSGNEVRGCTASGVMSGSPLECARSCPKGWIINKDSLYCYRKFKKPTLNSKAQKKCEGLKGTLPTVKDELENDYIQSIKGEGFTWLGMSDAVLQGKWIWADGIPVGWSNWENKVESISKNKDCAVMKDSGTWSSVKCEQKYMFMCKVHLQKFKESS